MRLLEQVLALGATVNLKDPWKKESVSRRKLRQGKEEATGFHCGRSGSA